VSFPGKVKEVRTGMADEVGGKPAKESFEEHAPLSSGASSREDHLRLELGKIVGRAVETGGGGVPTGKGLEADERLWGLDSDLDCRDVYREFVEQSNDAMYVVDLFGNFRFVNRMASKLIGHPEEDLLGRSIARFLYPEGVRKVISIIATLMRGREVHPLELTIRTVHGDRLVELKTTLVRRGEFPIGILGVARDMMMRAEAERALGEEEKYRLLFEQSPNAVLLAGAGGQLIAANPKACGMFGYSAGEFLRLRREDLLDASSAVSREAAAQRERTGRFSGQLPYRRKDGSVFTGEVNAQSFKDRQGNDRVSIVVSDVSERLRAESLVRIQRDLAAALASVTTLEEGLAVCLDTAIELSDMDSGGIYLTDAETGTFDLVTHKNLSPGFVDGVRSYGPDSAQAKLVGKGVPHFTDFESLPAPIVSPVAKEGLKALAVLPILHDNRTVGCMNISSRGAVDISVSSREALESIASQVGSAIARLRAEKALRESERKYRQLIMNIPVVTWTSDSEGNTVFISPNVTGVYGFTPAEIYESGDELFMGRIHPEDRKRIEGAYRALFEEDADFDVEYRIRHKDGTWIWIRDRAYSRREEGGHSFAVGVFHDITERKKAKEALQESEERYRSLVEQLKELIFTVSKDGVFTFVNGAIETLTGWSTDDVVGKPFSDIVHPEDLPLVRERFKRVLGGENMPDNELRLKMKSGTMKNFEYTSSRLFRKGEVIGVWGVARDVSDRKRVEEDRLNLIALREREGISRWLHDNLGADLYNIILLADSIQKQEPGSSVFTQQIDWITETSRKSLASIRNYLDFASQTGFSFEGLVAHMEEYGKSLLNPLGIQLHFEQEGDMARCGLSGVQIFSIYLIFKESLTNIVKHARASRVTVSVSVKEGRLELAIEDDGKGFTADAVLSGKFGTTNLRARADELGADLRVNTSPRKGTRVDFSLPLQ
jgi:PAS domain S-box-containing protein